MSNSHRFLFKDSFGILYCLKSFDLVSKEQMYRKFKNEKVIYYLQEHVKPCLKLLSKLFYKDLSF